MSMKPDSSKMTYRYLGKTGLRVSVIGWGNWVNNQNDELTKESVKICLENGINFFDTAEVYGLGAGEISLGKALKELGVQREKVVISTKIMNCGTDPNDAFLSRKHIIEGLKNSLKRLELDYVDVVFCHRPDMYTPLEETCRAMNWVIEKGYAFYWGTSQWSASRIMEAYKICDKLNLIPPVVEQTHYNMMFRDSKNANEFYQGENKKMWDEKLFKLKEIAEKKMNCTLAQLALAWVIANPDCSTTILGASKTSQLEENFKAVEISKKLDKGLLLEIEKILDNAPKGEIDYRDWKELPTRRNQNLGVDYIKGGAFN